MVGRYVALLAVAALLGACGSSSSKSSSSSSSGSPGAAPGVTLQLAGGKQNLNDMACGKQEAFEDYANPAQVRYSGQVTPAPSGRWKVKVKLKLCSGSSFVDVTSQKIVGQPSGRFEGLFPVNKPGYYSLRAKLESGSQPQSPKVYLKVG